VANSASDGNPDMAYKARAAPSHDGDGKVK